MAIAAWAGNVLMTRAGCRTTCRGLSAAGCGSGATACGASTRRSGAGADAPRATECNIFIIYNPAKATQTNPHFDT